MKTTFSLAKDPPDFVPTFYNIRDESDFVNKMIVGAVDEINQKCAELVGISLGAKGYENCEEVWKIMTAISGGDFRRKITEYYVEDQRWGAVFICRIIVEIVENKINFSHTLEK